MKNFNTFSTDLASRVKSAVEAQNLADAKILVKGQNWNSFTHFFSNLSAQKISKKNFVVIASIALTLAFVPLICELTTQPVENNPKILIPIQVTNFTEKVQVNFFSDYGFHIITIDGVDYNFDFETRENYNVTAYLLTDNGIELWAGTIIAESNHEIFFANSSTGVNFNYFNGDKK
jgi:hypothetical protein